MKDDIAKKLRPHLAKAINTECGVVYLLAEVRKILKPDDASAPRPFALWMYCHWALHVNLSRSSTTEYFLNEIDMYVSHTVAGLTPRGQLTIQDEDHLFRQFVYLETFRVQLLEFLKRYRLPLNLCLDDKNWFDFIASYAKVIEAGELSSETKKDNGLTAVDKVTFKVGNTLGADNHLPFTIIWDIHLKDRRILRVELDAIENLMMNCHLELIPAPQ